MERALDQEMETMEPYTIESFRDQIIEEDEGIMQKVPKMKKIESRLRKAVREGKWDDVVYIYTTYRHLEVQCIRISSSEGTALHVALYQHREDVLEQLLRVIDADRMKELTDERGNTLLHLAAKMGNSTMCYLVACKLPSLIGIRNNDEETPLFLAVLRDNKCAFCSLYDVCLLDKENLDKLNVYGRRNDGSTILHCAIDGEYFDLAHQIIILLPGIVHCVDERGRSPLHLLASKQSAFRSSVRLNWLQNLFYNCILAETPRLENDDRPTLEEDSHQSYRSTDEENPPSNVEQKKDPLSNCIMAWRFIKRQIISRIKDLFLPNKIRKMKEMHSWSILLTNTFIENYVYFDYNSTGRKPPATNEDFKNISVRLRSKQKKKVLLVAADQTPILTAARNGITEIVQQAIASKFSLATEEVNSEGKNVMLVAVESRQPQVFRLLLNNGLITDILSRHVDNNGNNVLHLAAKLETSRPWLAPNAVLQMQWEIKWYEFIKNNVPRVLLAQQNKQGLTPEEIFMSTHKDLLKSDTEWLMKTSDSCTIVAALVATVAFATSSSVPGDFEKGEPFLKDQRMFKVFGVSSLVALCFSLTAVVMFLATLTSRHQATDFRKDLPIKLLVGLTALFLSIVTMLVSFCGGHFFVVKGTVREAPIATEYLLAFLPVVAFGIAQCPLYYKLVKTMLNKVPERGCLDAT